MVFCSFNNKLKFSGTNFDLKVQCEYGCVKKTLSKKRDVVISHLLLRSLQDNEVYCAQWGQILNEVALELRNIIGILLPKLF